LELVDTRQVFDDESNQKVMMILIKTRFCGHCVWIDKFERLKLLQWT